MSLVSYAIPINDVNDTIDTIDGSTVNETAVVYVENTSGLFFEDDTDGNPNICYTAPSDSPKVTVLLTNAGTSTNYTTYSDPFVGGRPATHPRPI